ncbi:hypothetical protein [Eleftheria terrae]|uniref:hypothetical protein n=1 Tax=Eleftheria terrae TaxID=1597781 RepID=UPI00263B8905|nr:hypothetical protein [Eleftheria terrae]WKB56033.1 hypothetical protein N7L95_28630 [Eleftheria terrae]
MDRPNSYTLLVHEALHDGRFVVTNASSADVPIATLFVGLVAEQGAVDGDGVYRVAHRDAATTVSLRVVGIEFFRRSVDFIPKGHHAGVKFEGDDSDVLRAILQRHEKPWQVLLRANVVSGRRPHEEHTQAAHPWKPIAP